MLIAQPQRASSWAFQDVLGLPGELYEFSWKLDKNRGVGLWDRSSALYAVCCSALLETVRGWFQGRHSTMCCSSAPWWRIDCKWVTSKFFSFFGPSHFRNISHPVLCISVLWLYFVWGLVFLECQIPGMMPRAWGLKKGCFVGGCKVLIAGNT